MTVLTYEDWSSLVWYTTGHAVVAVKPPGYAKLAFDPGRLTGLGQPERRALVREAFDGDIAALARVAGTTGSRRIVVGTAADGRWGLLDVPLALAYPGPLPHGVTLVEGNGWDGLALAAGTSIEVPTHAAGGSARLEIRLLDRREDPPTRRLVVAVARRDGSPVGASQELVVGPEFERFQVATVEVDLPPGGRIVITARDDVLVQGIRGFTPPPLAIDGWRIAATTDRAVVLETSR
jgi:hypothetical protein